MAELVAELPLEPSRAVVYEEGWQSWTPSGSYRLGQAPARAVNEHQMHLGYRADVPTSPHGYSGDGLLAVADGLGTSHVFSTSSPEHVPRIHLALTGDRCRILADSPVVHLRFSGQPIHTALEAWGDRFVTRLNLPAPRSAPTAWCSWYQYGPNVAESDIAENLADFDRHDLPFDVVQIDDGYQAQIGDWLLPGERIADLRGLTTRIHHHGRRAGIWVAPFLVGSRSRLAREHPDWLVPDGYAGRNWDQELAVLDVTHPGAEQYLRDVFGGFMELGIDYFKLDFCYAGAVSGRRHQPMAPIAAYRHGMSVVRQVVGEAFLVGCGAPILPSIGLFDAMRVSADTAPYPQPASGDLSSPGQRGAIANARARSWQNNRLWLNDPDCLIARPGVHARREWARHVSQMAGLRTTSDRIANLDSWGLAATRAYLSGEPIPA